MVTSSSPFLSPLIFFPEGQMEKQVAPVNYFIHGIPQFSIGGPNSTCGKIKKKIDLPSSTIMDLTRTTNKKGPFLKDAYGFFYAQ